MICIEVRRNPRGEIERLETRGHAGYDDHGRDIVCAAVSAVVQTAVIGLEEYLGLKLRIRRREGLLVIELFEIPEAFEKREALSAILETALLGLEEIAANYDGRIEIIEKGGKHND